MSIATLKRVSILSACGISVVVTAFSGWLWSHGVPLGGGVYFIHNLAVLSIVATWVVADTPTSGRYFPSLDHGWFVMFLPFYLTYYLISTRRWWGVLILAGMLILFVLPRFPEMLMSHGS